MKQLVISAIVISALIGGAVSSFAATTQVDSLIQKLVDKGILNKDEARELKGEILETEHIRIQDEAKKVVPEWVQNTKWKGDLRLRNQTLSLEDGKDNTQQRIRFRYGFESKANDKLTVSAGFASGSSDSPTSTNQTLEQEFQKKQIWIDYAYAKYQPVEWATLEGGRFKKPFFSTDMLWDSDINYDGAVAKLARKGFYLTLAALPIDNISNSPRDLWIEAYQGGTETKFKNWEGNEVAKLKTDLAFYNFHSFENYLVSTLAEEIGTNSTANSRLRYDFIVLSPTATLEFKNPFGLGIPLMFLGEYANNAGAPTHNEAWRGGLSLGSEVQGKGDWKLTGQYSRLGRDAFYDGFTDSDFDGGGTNAKGWEMILDYGLAKNVILGLDYYNTQAIVAANGQTPHEQVIQTDVIVKF